MPTGINLGQISVDENGRVTFGGATGINVQETVEAIMTAKRIPVDRLESRVTSNTTKKLALEEFQDLLVTMQDTTDVLRNKLAFQNTGNIFKSKQVFNSVSRSDGQIPTSAGNLFAAAADNTAQSGVYEFEVLRTATAHKVASSEFSSKSTSLNDASLLGPGFTGGTIEIEGVAITIGATDSLQTITSKINNANTGASATGVNASIVTVSSSKYLLTLTSEGTGEDIRVVDTDNILQDLDIVDGSGTYNNVLQKAQASRIKLTGLPDIDRYESKFYSNQSTALGLSGTLTVDSNDIVIGAGDSLSDIAADIDAISGVSAQVFQDKSGYRLEITKDDGSTLTISSTDNIDSTMQLDNTQVVERTGSSVSVTDDTYTSRYFSDDPDVDALGYSGDLTFNGGTYTVQITDTLQDIADGINANTTDITASVVEDGNGYRLVVTEDNEATLNMTDSIAGLGLINDEVVKGDGNTISDIFNGITLDIFTAEEDTFVTLEVEPDLSGIQTAILDFVDAFNAMQTFYNTHRQIDPVTREPAEDAVLFGSPALRDIQSQLNTMYANIVSGVDNDFSGLAQIGVEKVNNGLLSDPLQFNTLEVDTSTLNTALLDNLDDVRRLFGFEFTSSDPQLVILDYDGDTDYQNMDFVLDITHDGNSITAATIDGSAVDLEINDNTITITSGNAKGLTLFYNGTSSSTINLSYTTGIASEMYFSLDSFLDTNTGLLSTEIDSLDDQNELLESKVERETERLASYESRLLARFIRMEEAISRGNDILGTIEQLSEALSSNK